MSSQLITKRKRSPTFVANASSLLYLDFRADKSADHADSDHAVYLVHFLHQRLSHFATDVYEAVGEFVSRLIHHVLHIEVAIGDDLENAGDHAGDVVVDEADPHMLARLHEGGGHIDAV